MVTVPASSARISTGPANQYLSPSIAAGTAVDMSQGLFRAAQAAASLVEKQRAARDAVELMRANTGATKELNDLHDQIEQGGDFKNGVTTFEQGAAAIAEKYGQSVSDPVSRERFNAHVSGLAESRRVALRRSLFELEVNDAKSALDENLATLAQAAATSTSQVERQQHESAAANAIATLRDARYLKPTEAVNLMQGFRGKIDAVTAEQVIQADPAKAEKLLGDPRFLPNLDPLKREKLIERSAAINDRVERRKIAEEDRQERLARKKIEEQSDRIEKALIERWDPNPLKSTLTVDMVDLAKPFIKEPTRYQALRGMALGTDYEAKDIPGAVAQLEPLLHTPRGVAAVDGAKARREISDTTYVRMRERAVAWGEANGPKTPYVSGREFLSKALDPGQMGDNKFVQQALSMAQQRALADYDAYVDANKGIDRPTALAQADKLVKQYQNIAFGEIRIAMPRPEGYVGDKSAVKPEDLLSSRKLVKSQLDSGQISNAEAARKLDAIEQWEGLLTKSQGAPAQPGKAAPATPALKPAP